MGEARAERTATRGHSYATLPAAQFWPSVDATAAQLIKRYGRSFQGIAVEDYRDTAALLNTEPSAG